MDDKLLAFKNLSDVFSSSGYHLYLVGGSVRDYLLGLPLEDMDAVTDATPDEVVAFLNPVDTTFKRMGSLKYKSPEGVKFDITTMRKEEGYSDMRHPNTVLFVKDLKEDYLRRDFTINALYMDKDLKVYDYCDGVNNLNNRILRVVGNADKRLKEDPLRILRAIRFHLTYRLSFEESLLKAMQDNFALLSNLTDAKIRSELSKIPFDKVDVKEKETIFKQFDIANLQGVIK